uniref:Acyl-CoA dehydrogenase n=1 Tax=Desulfomonile tiedjei TaxID=2358 RepID=A0A7C4EWD2_9BACT
MDFSISDKMETILEMVREFIDKEVIPLEKSFLRSSFRNLLPRLEEKRQMVRHMELWAPPHPKEYGGMGLDLVEFALVSEELGRSPLGHFVFGCQAPDAGNIEILHLYGTDEQKKRYLAPLVRGDIRSCFSMTEVEMPGSNPVMLETTATRDGDFYVINGQKWYTTAADGAAFAIVMAVTNPDAPPHLRASMLIVPTDTPGFNLVRNISIMGHEGDDWHSHAEILYQSCRVPAENLLGPEGHGFVIAQERLGPGRIHHCMRWIGECQRALELMCRRANSRAIAPGKNLASRQIIQTWVAECSAEIQAARLMVLHAAWKMNAQGTKAAREEISLIKFYVAKVLQRVIDLALQVHGGLGMSDDTILSFLYRFERAARIYDGVDEVHKVSVAKRILQRYI